MSELDDALASASRDPSARADFYRLLLDGTVFIALHEPVRTDAQGRLAAGSKLSILNCAVDGVNAVAIFTSLDGLRHWAGEQAHYVRMGTRDAFTLTSGATIALNPAQSFGKIFTAEEIAALLDGSIFRPSHRHVVKQATEVQMGQPSRYPTLLVEALRKVFARQAIVRSAYLVHFFNPQVDERPHSLIAVECDGPESNAFADAGIAIAEMSTEETNGPVDFMCLAQNGFGAAIRAKFTPFYQRRPPLIRRPSSYRSR
jgi:hypothetical protein